MSADVISLSRRPQRGLTAQITRGTHNIRLSRASTDYDRLENALQSVERMQVNPVANMNGRVPTVADYRAQAAQMISDMRFAICPPEMEGQPDLRLNLYLIHWLHSLLGSAMDVITIKASELHQHRLACTAEALQESIGHLHDAIQEVEAAI